MYLTTRKRDPVMMVMLIPLKICWAICLSFPETIRYDFLSWGKQPIMLMCVHTYYVKGPIL